MPRNGLCITEHSPKVRICVVGGCWQSRAGRSYCLFPQTCWVAAWLPRPRQSCWPKSPEIMLLMILPALVCPGHGHFKVLQPHLFCHQSCRENHWLRYDLLPAINVYYFRTWVFDDHPLLLFLAQGNLTAKNMYHACYDVQPQRQLYDHLHANSGTRCCSEQLFSFSCCNLSVIQSGCLD